VGPGAKPVGLKFQRPVASAVTLPMDVAPSVSTICPSGSVVPVNVGSDVILSPGVPVSLASFSVTTGATVSSVKVSEALPVLPAAWSRWPQSCARPGRARSA
jgi:hypothetical protein